MAEQGIPKCSELLRCMVRIAPRPPAEAPISSISNANFGDRLGSLLRYRDVPSIAGPLRQIVLAAAQLPALEYHYDRMARRAFADVAQAATPRLKRYFYALRPALALRWLRARRTPQALAGCGRNQ